MCPSECYLSLCGERAPELRWLLSQEQGGAADRGPAAGDLQGLQRGREGPAPSEGGPARWRILSGSAGVWALSGSLLDKNDSFHLNAKAAAVLHKMDEGSQLHPSYNGETKLNGGQKDKIKFITYNFFLCP